MALFENYEGRIPQIQPVLDKYGFKDFEDVKAFNNAKGVRYLEMTEGYVLKIALDKDDQVCGYQFLSLGKMMDAIKKGENPGDAYEKNIGTYGRFKAEDGAVKWIDPRKE